MTLIEAKEILMRHTWGFPEEVQVKSEDPVTLAAIRLTPGRAKFWRQFGALLLIFIGLGAIFGLIAGAQYMTCPKDKTFVECVRNK